MILAIALSAMVLTLIGMAINMYLVRTDSSGKRVAQAQLARTILSMIADDIRDTTIYKPQDTSSISNLMAKSATFDVDSIDKPSSGSSGATSGVGGATAAAGATSVSSSSSTGTSSATGQSSTGTSSSDDTAADNVLPLGLSGDLDELYVDTTHLPKQEELFSTITGYTNAPSPVANGGLPTDVGAGASSGIVPPTDVKNVHYFVRPGNAVEPGSASVTSLDPAAQESAGGLVRQEIPHPLREFAEKNGGSDELDSGQTLIAPEVVHIEFHYFDGSQVVDTWDMREQKSLPTAVEVCVWLRSPNAANQPITDNLDTASLANSAREYREVVYLPMAQMLKSASSNGSGDSSSTDSTDMTDSSSTSDASSPSSTGSSFDDMQ
ncbi:MAG TPA: hypothetical protein VHE81_23090 [Lacipirellulaceae bacterium]|nr:hypothetical protein [Lacipirellulaceae bacterium]